MKQRELVLLEVLSAFFQRKQTRFTQLGLSKSLGLSLSAVNGEVRRLSAMGAVEISPRGFRVVDAEKILFHWCNERDLQRDVIYRTRVDAPVSQVEKSMPPGAVYTAYSACKFALGHSPADYGEVLVYAMPDAAQEIKRRFPAKAGPPNLTVLAGSEALERAAQGGMAPLALVYADLWNLKEWYAKEFRKSIEARLGL